MRRTGTVTPIEGFLRVAERIAGSTCFLSTRFSNSHGNRGLSALYSAVTSEVCRLNALGERQGKDARHASPAPLAGCSRSRSRPAARAPVSGRLADTAWHRSAPSGSSGDMTSPPWRRGSNRARRRSSVNGSSCCNGATTIRRSSSTSTGTRWSTRKYAARAMAAADARQGCCPSS